MRLSLFGFAVAVIPFCAPAFAAESLINGGFEDGTLNGWSTNGRAEDLHNPPVQECVCGHGLRAVEGQFFGGLTYVQNVSPLARDNIRLRQILDVKNWNVSADRTRFDLEVWVQLAHANASGWDQGYVYQEYNIRWNDSGVVPGDIWAGLDHRIRVARMDSMSFTMGAAPNYLGWRKLKVSGSLLGNPRQIVFEIILSYSNNPPTCHNCFDGVVLSAESAVGSSIGPFAGDIPNGGFEQGPYNAVHWYQDPHPPAGWTRFFDFEKNDRGPIEGYTNGVTTPTDPNGVTTPSGEHFWGRVMRKWDFAHGGKGCEGYWAHVLPVRKWSPHAIGFRWRLHYLTKLWDTNDSGVEWFQLCWDRANPESGRSILDPPSDPYQDWGLPETRFVWLELININDRSLAGASETSGFVEIEQTGEFSGTGIDGKAVCPQYVLLKNRTYINSNANRDFPFQLLYDKIDFYVEAISGCNDPAADLDGDADVDQADFGLLQMCYTGPGGGVPEGCKCADLNRDAGAIDGSDVTLFDGCASGPGVDAADDCVPSGL